jgi:hypothetical protein
MSWSDARDLMLTSFTWRVPTFHYRTLSGNNISVIGPDTLLPLAELVTLYAVAPVGHLELNAKKLAPRVKREKGKMYSLHTTCICSDLSVNQVAAVDMVMFRSLAALQTLYVLGKKQKSICNSLSLRMLLRLIY